MIRLAVIANTNINTAIGRVFAAHMPADMLKRLLTQEHIRLAGADVNAELPHEYHERLIRIRAAGIEEAFDAPVPGIGAFAVPIFDHTASIRLVIAVIGSSGSFDEGPQGPTGRALLAAAQRLSWRFGALGTTGTTLSASNMQRR